MALQDLTGKVFSRLTVIRYAGKVFVAGSFARTWQCQCKCGNTVTLRTAALTSGNTKSCGCFQKDGVRQRSRARRIPGTTEDGKRTPEYVAWKNMRKRCNNPQEEDYAIYKARGITVCPEWDSFPQFLADMGSRPSPRHSIDRINGDLGYCKDNCRWATPREQGRNKRTNRMLAFDGQLFCLNEWAEMAGLTRSCIRTRLKYGWDIGRILTTPSRSAA